MKINESRAPSPLERARLTLCLQNRNNRMKSKVIRKFYVHVKFSIRRFFFFSLSFLLPFFQMNENHNSFSLKKEETPPPRILCIIITFTRRRIDGQGMKKKNRFPLRYNEKSMEEQPFSFRRIEESKLSNHCQDKDRYAPARSSRRRLYSVLVTW